MAKTSLDTERIRESKGFSVTIEDMHFVFSGKSHLVKTLNMYCFLSKTIQLTNLREINNIALISTNVENFWRKNEGAARISRLFIFLPQTLRQFKKFPCVKFPHLFFFLAFFLMACRCST